MRNFVIAIFCLLLAACHTGSAKEKEGNSEVLTNKQAAKMEKQAKKDAQKTARIEKDKKAENTPAESPPSETLNKTVQTSEVAPRVTFDAVDSSLGRAVEQLASNIGGSLVLMAGIEVRGVGDLHFKDTPFEDMAKLLADKTGCLVQACPNYLFIYPNGYESLLQVSLDKMLDPSLTGKKVSVSFGSETPFFEIMALMSGALNVAFVADNVVASAQTGSLTLAEIPVQNVLEALLKSARIPMEAFKIESTPEYVFIYSVRAAGPHSTLLNGSALSPEQNAALDKEVHVVLPMKGEMTAPTLVPHAVSLQEVLPALSAQINIPVELADAKLGEIPINPCLLPKVRVRTAMDLIIRQWPDSNFGYLFQGNKIIIQRIATK